MEGAEVIYSYQCGRSSTAEVRLQRMLSNYVGTAYSLGDGVLVGKGILFNGISTAAEK